ncbi:MAG: 4'-phosphopantetheinyl transferase superfamily protein [Acidobacteriota bacterium]|nr:4'-phosphopantetheinyl transferase superfamily protein [Acidobacteriota bacterium]
MRQPLPDPRRALSPWPTPPEQLSLEVNDVHIWRASLEQSPATVAQLRPLLSPDEQSRADRFHFERDRRHFTTARAYLRTLLGTYLGMTPQEIRFSYTEFGKPALALELNQQLKFNLAHSGGLALYGFTRIGEIGIDLEYIRPEFTGREIADRFFSRMEVASLNQLPKTERHQAFFNCWTRKEAFIKAKGLGLSLGLDQFDVTLAPEQAAALLQTRWDEKEAARWSLMAIEAGPEYAAAVALEAHDWQPSYWEVNT